MARLRKSPDRLAAMMASNLPQAWAAAAVVWPRGARGTPPVDSIVTGKVIVVAAVVVVVVISHNEVVEGGVSRAVDKCTV